MGINDKNVLLENVRLVFKNFAGKEGKYNREGDRNFAVVLPDDIAETMKADSWNVKTKPPREEGEENFNYLAVAVSFKGRPPRIYLIVEVPDGEGGWEKKRVPLDEETCDMLDWADAANVDVMLRPYDWAVSGNTGRKAYLQAIYVTLNQDELERKYAAIPEIETGSSQLALEGGSSQLALESGSNDDDDVIDVESWE